MAQRAKNMPAMQEKQKIGVWSLAWEDPLVEEIAIHSSIRAWKIARTEEPGGYSLKNYKKLDTTEHENVFLCCIYRKPDLGLHMSSHLIFLMLLLCMRAHPNI